MRKPKILLVDDSPQVGELVKRTLEASCYTVVVAASTEAALEQLAQGPPDLLLLEPAMPGLDGLALCRRLRQSPETQTLPIVFLSAHAGLQEKRAGFQAGADDYLAKDYDLADLPYRVGLVLRLHGASSPVA